MEGKIHFKIILCSPLTQTDTLTPLTHPQTDTLTKQKQRLDIVHTRKAALSLSGNQKPTTHVFKMPLNTQESSQLRSDPQRSLQKAPIGRTPLGRPGLAD